MLDQTDLLRSIRRSWPARGPHFCTGVPLFSEAQAICATAVPRGNRRVDPERQDSHSGEHRFFPDFLRSDRRTARSYRKIESV